VHISVGTSLEETERQLTLKTFAFTAGNHAKTASILGVKEKDLRQKLLEYLDEGVAATS
jgi:DNA-binding NtrC family response regulator